MSSEGEEPLHLLNQAIEIGNESVKKTKISYGRDFLLSLSELDVCKKLPSGFDRSLVGEFEETSDDRYRIPGSFSSQSYRRNDFSSSPPTRGETSHFSRGVNGRWDSRSSSGKSDRDTDAQSWDSDSGRRYSNQSRRPWQGSEHDGLLGSGSFPRLSGYVTGVSGPRFQANESYQLNRSKEPYHPPRPYKAMPYSRRDANDSINDETFGSLESTSEDRAEEERKRRADFELMRKEQQKAFQEKLKLNPEKSRDEFDISLLMEDSHDEQRHINRRNEIDEAETQHISDGGLHKPQLPNFEAPIYASSLTSALASRPLVPPGFSSSVEKNIVSKSMIKLLPLEGGNEINGSLLDSKGNHLLQSTSIGNERKQSSHEMGFSELQKEPGSLNARVAINSKSENVPDLPSLLDSSNKTIPVDVLFNEAKNCSKAIEVSGVCELEVDGVMANKVMGESKSTCSTSILEKLFGSSLALNGSGSSNFNEHDDVGEDDTWRPLTAQSSKFAQWFPEEDKRTVDDLASSKANELLSLIAGGENGGSQGVDITAAMHIPPKFSIEHSELVDSRTISNPMTTSAEDVERLYSTSILKSVPAILTCEDLEQSMLSEITVTDSSSALPILGRNGHGADRIGETKDNVDNHASKHLLSLLQKGTGPEDRVLTANIGIRSLDELQNRKVVNAGSVEESGAECIPNPGKPLTLETLFGTAFMKELQSVGAPSSEQGDSLFDVPLSGNSGLVSNQRPQIKSEMIEEQFLGLDPQLIKPDPSQLQMEFGFEGSAEIQLPMEDDLIAPTGSLNLQNLMSGRSLANPELLSDLEAPVNVSETDFQYHDLHHQPPQSNHAVPLFHVSDSDPASTHSPMKFTSLENLVHHDTSTTDHQFSTSMVRPPFHHPTLGVTGINPSVHTAMLQQMQIPGSFPPPHLLHAFPRGGPLPPHPNNQVTGFVTDPNQMQGLPLGQRQPNFGGPRIPQQVSAMGGVPNHPDAVRRLMEMEMEMEMELRLKHNQFHPFAVASHSRAMYGHELDMGFGFR